MFSASRQKFLAWVLPVLFAVLLLGLSAWSQATARLDGTVMDSTGAVIPNCQVVLTNTNSGVKYTAETNGTGLYVFPVVPTGTYDLVFSRQGFQTKLVGAIVLHANDRRAVNINLPVQGVAEKVDVSATGGFVSTVDSGQKTETLASEQIANFSTIGRNSEELLPLLPGVVLNGSSAYYSSFDSHVLSSAHGIEGFNMNGNRSDMNSYKLDGASLVDLTANNGSDIYPNTEFISELTVSSSNYTADQGGSPVLVTATTKAGGKSFHGEAYWSGRNGAFDANDWSNKAAGIGRPASKFNYPGFNISGPVWLPGTKFNRGSEPKLFFFFGTEWSRQTPDLGTLLSVVPTPAQLTGDFSDIVFSADCVSNPTGTHLQQPCHMIDPDTGADVRTQGGKLTNPTGNGKGLLKQLMGPGFKGPNGFYVDSQGRQWNFAGRQFKPQNVTQYVGRFDYNVSDKTRLFMRIGRQDETMFSDFGEYNVPGVNYNWGSNIPEPTTTVQNYNARSLALNMVNVLSPTLTNELSFSTAVLRQTNYYQDASQLSKDTLGVSFKGANILGAYPAENYPIVPQINVGFNCTQLNSTGCGVSIAPYAGRYGNSNLVNPGNFYKNTVFEISDNLTKVAGSHTLKFGGYWQRGRNDQNGAFIFREGILQLMGWAGSVSGSEFGDILTERFKGYQQGNGAPTGYFRATTTEWYAQDSWKVMPRLTLEYGVRWAWLLPWSDAHGQGVTFDPSAYDRTKTGVYNGIRTSSCDAPGHSAVPMCGTIPYGIKPNGHPVAQPRLGFAWDSLGDGRLVLRGGFGQYSSRDQGNAMQSVISAPPNLLMLTTYYWNLGSKGYFNLADLENAPAYAPASFSISPFGVYDVKDSHVPAVYQYNLTISSALPHKLFAEIAYVGSQSRHLLVTKDLNSVPLGALWECYPNCSAPGASHILKGSPFPSPDAFRPYQPFTSIDFLSHDANSNYNALQASLRRQAGRNLDFITSYTFSKAMGQSDYYGALLFDPFIRTNNYRPLGFDRTHTFSIGYQYRVPGLAQGALSKSKIARGALNGWMLTGITKATSGSPYAINVNVACQPLDGSGKPIDPPGSAPCPYNLWAPFSGPGVNWFGSSAYLGYLPGNVQAASGVLANFTCDPVNSKHGGLNSSWINTDCLTLPAFGKQGAFRQPYLKTPGYLNFDMAVQKTFKLTEARRLEFRFSAFNLTNRGQLAPPNQNANFLWQLPANATDPSQGKAVLDVKNDGYGNPFLGKIGGKLGHRELQATLKFFF